MRQTLFAYGKINPITQKEWREMELWPVVNMPESV